MTGDNQPKVCLVTGASRGIGRGIALELADLGYTVVGTATTERGVSTYEALLTENKGKGRGVVLDVTKPEMVHEVVAGVTRDLGAITILINNAGILRNEGVEKTTLEVWDTVIAVNQTGTFLGMKHAIPAIRQAGGGSIINISSVAGLVGTGAAIAYQASKGAVRLMTKTAAIEYAKDKIRINSIHPGVISTVMVTESFSPRARQRYEQTIPLGREGTADEIAQGALFLASDESSYMTGAELVIDGGYTAQ